MSKLSSITSIQMPVYTGDHALAGQAPKVYHVFYTNGRVEHIHERTRPRRFAACKRFIGGHQWNRSDVVGGTLIKMVGKVPTLAESFADAAIAGLVDLTPENASQFESSAAYELRIAMQSSTVIASMDSLKAQRNAARRAIVYRWYARTLMSGQPNRAALVEALEGIE